MTGKRTRYSAEFKSKVALEVLRGELTAAQLAAKHGIQQTMVGEWKRQVERPPIRPDMRRNREGLALQLRILFHMCLLRCGLMGSSP